MTHVQTKTSKQGYLQLEHGRAPIWRYAGLEVVTVGEVAAAVGRQRARVAAAVERIAPDSYEVLKGANCAEFLNANSYLGANGRVRPPTKLGIVELRGMLKTLNEWGKAFEIKVGDPQSDKPVNGTGRPHNAATPTPVYESLRDTIEDLGPDASISILGWSEGTGFAFVHVAAAAKRLENEGVAEARTWLGRHFYGKASEKPEPAKRDYLRGAPADGDFKKWALSLRAKLGHTTKALQRAEKGQGALTKQIQRLKEKNASLLKRITEIRAEKSGNSKAEAEVERITYINAGLLKRQGELLKVIKMYKDREAQAGDPNDALMVISEWAKIEDAEARAMWLQWAALNLGVRF